MELDLKYVEKTLPHVQSLWGKTVHLESVMEEKRIVFSYDGSKNFRRFLYKSLRLTKSFCTETQTPSAHSACFTRTEAQSVR